MFYVYFLKSIKNRDLYIGSCQHVGVRVERHNSGHVRSTKAYCPWKLVGYEELNTRGDAMRREMFLKTGQQKELLKKKFKDVI